MVYRSEAPEPDFGPSSAFLGVNVDSDSGRSLRFYDRDNHCHSQPGRAGTGAGAGTGTGVREERHYEDQCLGRREAGLRVMTSEQSREASSCRRSQVELLTGKTTLYVKQCTAIIPTLQN